MNTSILLLVVEDEAALRSALKTKLQREGYTVITAENGSKALAVALEKKPELIVLDILMPEMDGIQFLQKIREDSWGKTVKVIVLSNLTSEEQKIAVLRLGAQEYLVKSDWSISDLIEKIKNYLSDQPN